MKTTESEHPAWLSWLRGFIRGWLEAGGTVEKMPRTKEAFLDRTIIPRSSQIKGPFRGIVRALIESAPPFRVDLEIVLTALPPRGEERLLILDLSGGEETVVSTIPLKSSGVPK